MLRLSTNPCKSPLATSLDTYLFITNLSFDKLFLLPIKYLFLWRQVKIETVIHNITCAFLRRGCFSEPVASVQYAESGRFSNYFLEFRSLQSVKMKTESLQKYEGLRNPVERSTLVLLSVRLSGVEN